MMAMTMVMCCSSGLVYIYIFINSELNPFFVAHFPVAIRKTKKLFIFVSLIHIHIYQSTMSNHPSEVSPLLAQSPSSSSSSLLPHRDDSSNGSTTAVSIPSSHHHHHHHHKSKKSFLTRIKNAFSDNLKSVLYGGMDGITSVFVCKCIVYTFFFYFLLSLSPSLVFIDLCDWHWYGTVLCLWRLCTPVM